MSDSASKDAAKASSPRPSSCSCAASTDPAAEPTAVGEPAPHSRLFFALWPAPALARNLHALARAAAAQHGGRVMRIDTLHLTMAFLGDLPDSRIASLADVGAECARTAAPADLPLDHLGYWSRKQLIWIGPHTAPPSLAELAETLSGRLGDAVSDRRFNPHITLVRKAGGAPELPLPALTWRVDELHLVRSIIGSSGAQYATIARWPLAG